ncbi:hypothetical protein K0U27_08760 [archaeon]|nr:hypothetical protein [archaeon]
MTPDGIMPADGPVSLTRQTIYALIPIIDLYAAYHIKKLRWYLLIMIGLGFAMMTVSELINPSDWETQIGLDAEYDESSMMMGDDADYYTDIALFIVSTAIEIGIAVYLIRRWSKEWNEKFQQ